MRIPLTIPDIRSEDHKEVLRILQSTWISMGPEVKRLEKNLSEYLGMPYAVAVNNGTAALDVALKTIGIKKGDEVIIPGLTYVATGHVVLYNNATPVFVDVDDTLNINPDIIEESITDNTKAIINIDYGGNPSDYDKLLKVSQKHGMPLIVDGAQSLGALYKGEKCCTHGLVNTLSFSSTKLLTTGEGGMVFTSRKDIADKARLIRFHGEDTKYIHVCLGNNYRMTDIHAVLGNCQFPRLNEIIQGRIKKALFYRDSLTDIAFPKQLNDTSNTYFFFLVLVDDRNRLAKYLYENGVGTRSPYPLPLNEQPSLKEYGTGVLSMAKLYSKQVLALPMYHSLSEEQQSYVIGLINKFYRGR